MTKGRLLRAAAATTRLLTTRPLWAAEVSDVGLGGIEKTLKTEKLKLEVSRQWSVFQGERALVICRFVNRRLHE
jgi:hypothetical protein